MGVASIEPFAGLNHVSLDMDRFTEVGGATALSVDGLDRDVTFADFGLRLAANPVGGVAPYLSGAYRRAWGDRMSEATIAFAGNSAGGTITGLPIARSAAEVEAGVRYSGAEVRGPAVPSSTVGHFRMCVADIEPSGSRPPLHRVRRIFRRTTG
jgi:outer membrane autotransporter protein